MWISLQRLTTCGSAYNVWISWDKIAFKNHSCGALPFMRKEKRTRFWSNICVVLNFKIIHCQSYWQGINYIRFSSFSKKLHVHQFVHGGQHHFLCYALRTSSYISWTNSVSWGYKPRDSKLCLGSIVDNCKIVNMAGINKSPILSARRIHAVFDNAYL